ncbi:cell wall-binding repeat-containing protein [Rossellomorea oryzaecorticis]|uniref:Cell wall-binding repeat-containing protein n=1 Tax=Rossellomorea oryzaecorticis TaxID=1396505 RepID=A0ABU9K428_9BACI
MGFLRKTVVSVVSASVILAYSPITEASASTISVKLKNYIGNRTSLVVNSQGTYKLENNNKRFSGGDRYEVAENVASNGWDTAETVFVVNSVAFADALAASPLAYKYNAPILLTRAGDIPDSTFNKIKTLSPNKIIIVGGTGSVNGAVENKLKSITANVSRIDGKDRFEVSKKIAQNLGASSEAFLTNGLIFSDALAIAPYAAKNEIPILLTRKDSIPAPTYEAIKGKSDVTVIGGTGSVDNNVYNSAKATKRIDGKDRYEVSANIVNELNINSPMAYVSNGLTFADALTGSVLAAKNGSPLLLTRADSLPDVINSLIDNKDYNVFNILGGPASVEEKVVNQLPNEFKLQAGTDYVVKNESGRLAMYQGSTKVADFGQSDFVLKPLIYSEENALIVKGNANRQYLGKMKFTSESDRYVRPINLNIPYEDYLKSVVPRESPYWYHAEALKAQAVAARTYAIHKVGQTVLDDQSFQVYGGYDWKDETSAAVEGTKGLILRSGGEPITAFFSSSNGGEKATNIDEWGGEKKLSYLSNGTDTFDDYKWKLKVPKNLFDDQDIISISKKTTGYPNISIDKALISPSWWFDNVNESHTVYLDDKNDNQDIYTSKSSQLVTNVKKYLGKHGYVNKDIKVKQISKYEIDPQLNAGKRIEKSYLTVQFYMREKGTKDYYYEDGFGDQGIGSPIKLYEQKLDILEHGANVPYYEKVRYLFGTLNLRSTLIENVDNNNDDFFLVYGKGFGHGVGMSQQGANNRANNGQTYQQILNFYYPNTTLGN